MPFNRELAEDLAFRTGDRDDTRYFCGRAEELESFAATCIEAGRKPQSAFRLYTGAPGCGKTSLLSHIRKTHADVKELLFVPARSKYLVSEVSLQEGVLEAALKVQGVKADVRGGLSTGLKTVAEMLRAKTFGEAVEEWRRERAIDGLTVVLQVDEAQNLDAESLKVLAELHAYGLAGVKSVVLAAGLAHAKDVLTGGGISRTAHNADVDMGLLAREECVASTRMMLDDLGADGTDSERVSAAGRVAEFALGWPQHLFRAQQALCRGLLEAAGVIRDVNMGVVERHSSQARSDYYNDRLRGRQELERSPDVNYRVIVDVAREQPTRESELHRICKRRIDEDEKEHEPLVKTNPVAYATALVEKGVVCRTTDGYASPIPSMVMWAQEKIAGE